MIHDSIFDSSLRDCWQALVVFIVMITLADEEDVVDMTTTALAARSGLPLGVVAEGIAVLERPDPHSRTPDFDGRRIVRLDDHRPWGWRVVNRAAYKRMRDKEERRIYQRDLMRKRRSNVKADNSVSTLLADVSLGRRQETGDSSKKERVAERPALRLPTNRRGEFVDVPQEQIDRWASLFLAVDVPVELKKIEAWLEANPERRKTSKGMMRFVVRWLSKAQDEGRMRAPAQAPAKERPAAERVKAQKEVQRRRWEELERVARETELPEDIEALRRFEAALNGSHEGGD